MVFSQSVQQALARHATATAGEIQQLELGLAELHLEHGPPGARQHLDLAARFLAGEASPADLAEARQECWAHAGSLACGCSAADSATSAAFLAVLDASAAAHTSASLSEQVERALRAGVSEASVLQVLGKSPQGY